VALVGGIGGDLGGDVHRVRGEGGASGPQRQHGALDDHDHHHDHVAALRLRVGILGFVVVRQLVVRQLVVVQLRGLTRVRG
jgi:hypothetical protein